MRQITDRLVRNQILFREVNERVHETVHSSDGSLEYLCECSNDACIETIPLTADEYEHVRSRGNFFVVVEGHEHPEVERVVEKSPRYLLVETTVKADEVFRTDPRAQGA